MAAATTTTHLKFQTQPIKPKRRRCRETTITAAAAVGDNTSSAAAYVNQNRRLDTPTVVYPDGSSSWCCPASKPPATPPLDAASDLKIRYSPSSAMDSYQAGVYGGPSAAPQESFPSSLSKFNSALTAGLLNPMSPPPPPAADKTRSSPTLFEMMANEPECLPRTAALVQNGVVPAPNGQVSKLAADPSPQDSQGLAQQRLMDLLSSGSPGNQFNDPISGDVKLTLSARDGLNVSMSVHRQILVAHSRFFALKLNEKWAKQQRNSGPYIVEIADCEDIEVYIETMRLMYCQDLRRKLMKEDVPRVLGILKVSAAIGFDAGVLSCLEYLEAAPWTEDEEEKVSSLLSELRLEGVGAGKVLKRVSQDVTSCNVDGSDNNINEQVLLKLLQAVLEGKDEKARREMKSLITKMLRENPTQHDLRKESLYSACDSCLKSLRDIFLRAAEKDTRDVGQIARQADNLHWLLDIMIDRQIAEDFLTTWASQFELSEAHSKVQAVHRHEVSRVTARFFVGIGKGQLLASKEARCLLLRTWLGPFYEDFVWMRRGLDRHLVEEGLGNTILTLPMTWQKEIMMSWFDRFLSSGDECPNIQRGFEVWWRRSFWRRGVGGGGEAEKPRLMRIMAGADES